MASAAETAVVSSGFFFLCVVVVEMAEQASSVNRTLNPTC